MKIRCGFVSNSSSSSFVIQLKDITAEQLEKIVNHATIGAQLGIDYADSDYWNIEVDSENVRFSTEMDNFDMIEFLEKIGVNDSVIGDWWHSNGGYR
jgi:hypothetical protein